MAFSLSMLAVGAALVGSAPISKSPSAEQVSLAMAVVQASRRQELMRDTYAKQLRAGLTICRGDVRCQADLDKAISQAAGEVSVKYAANIAQLFARTLSSTQLRATLKFYRSPEGRGAMAAEIAASDTLAQIGHASMLYAQKSISRQFCPAHPEVCTTQFGQKVPTLPKS
jgi:hypothetical protein